MVTGTKPKTMPLSRGSTINGRSRLLRRLAMASRVVRRIPYAGRTTTTRRSTHPRIVVPRRSIRTTVSKVIVVKLTTRQNSNQTRDSCVRDDHHLCLPVMGSYGPDNFCLRVVGGGRTTPTTFAYASWGRALQATFASRRGGRAAPGNFCQRDRGHFCLCDQNHFCLCGQLCHDGKQL